MIERILRDAQYHADRLGIEIDVASVLSEPLGDDELIETFTLYDAEDLGVEIADRYLHAVLLDQYARRVELSRARMSMGKQVYNALQEVA